MNGKHTPGPWVYCEWACEPRLNEDGNRYWGIKPSEFHFGADYLEASGWMTEANARLIAAAPELLEACITAVKHFGPFAEITINGQHDADDVTAVAAMRAAIAKATGAA